MRSKYTLVPAAMWRLEHVAFVITIMIEKIKNTLCNFEPIGLEQMMSVKLMNRTDTKYVVRLEKLVELLEAARYDYFVQTNQEGERIAGYHTIYLDTPDYQMYTRHEVGHKPRQKVRMRTYLDTGEAFLEIKHKNNHGRTGKKRMKMEVPNDPVEANQLVPKVLGKLHQAPLFTHVDGQVLSAPLEPDTLQPQLENFFDRITLVNHGMTERLTIDLNLRFHNLETQNDACVGHLAIIELKRDGHHPSPMHDMLIRMHVHPGGFSKYCIGQAMTNPSLRINNFKEKLKWIKNLSKPVQR